MIEAGEVGAVFTVVDKASAVLKAIADQLKALQARIDAIQARFDGLGAGLGASFDKAALAISSGMGKAADNAIAELGRIDAAAAATAANVGRIGRGAALLGGPGRTPTGPGGFGGGGGGGPHFGSVGTSLPGGSRVSLPGGPLMAAGAAAGYGTYLAAQMDDAIFQLEYHAALPATAANDARLRGIIQGAMSRTGSSLDAVIEAAKDEVRMFKGTPGGGLDVLPEMLTAAATESRLKGSSLDESMKALIGLAHMTKEYGPEAIKALAPTFAFLSASNPSSLASIERAASYAVPILQSGMEVDPAQSLLLGTVLTRAGATNTKSGTWLRNMALAAMPGTSLQSKVAFKKHEQALSALGLIDKDNQPTWFTNGKPDLVKMLEIAGGRVGGIPLETRAAYEQQLFGKQGFGAFALLADPAVQKQVAALGAEMQSPEFKARYGNFMQDYSSASPLQQGRQTWADFQNALTDLGTTTLPIATAALKGFDDIFKAIANAPADFKAGPIAPGSPADWLYQHIHGAFAGSPNKVLPGPTTGPSSTVSPNTAGLGPVTLAPASVTGMGAAMTAAAAAIKPPQVKNDTKVDVTVKLDGATIAAQIEKHITQNTRVINGTSGFDTGAGVMPTDGGFVGP